MKEVSCKAFGVNFRALDKAGIPRERLVEGSPFTLEFLENNRNRIDWDDFADLLARFGQLIGGPAGLEGAGASAVDDFRKNLASFAGYISSSHWLYRMLERWLVHAAFHPIISTYRQLADKRILITGEIAEPYKECEEFFWISKGCFRMLPRLIGQPEANVEADITPRRAVYTITPPPSLTIVARLRRFFKIIGAGKTAIEELRGQQDQLRTSYDELWRTQNKLKESEARFRSLFEVAFGGMIIHDRGTILETNESAAGMFGYAREEVIGKSVLDFVDGSFRPDVVEKVASDKDHDYELVGVKKDGGRIDLEVISKPYTFEGRPARIAALRDITERRGWEADILKAKKLESIGVLAGGIAHDFNNLLAVNIWNLDLAQSSAGANRTAKARLAKARRAATRAKDLTERLLTFSLGGAPVRSTASLAELLRDQAALATRGSAIKCEVDIPDDLWAAAIDKGQINQAISNLLINAEEAIDGKGVIKIKAENTTVKKALSKPPLPKGRYVKITVTDAGRGMSQDLLAKIFDPFFTTKKRGTGLGLATAHSIINKHGGEILAESKAGMGSSFYVYLPACAQDAPVRPAKASARPAGQGRILVVDDNEDIREALESALSQFGFKVDVAADGRGAFDLFRRAREAGEPFDAVVMDLTIPGGMGGKEAVKQLLEIDPKAKVIASSGYSNDEVAAEYARFGFSGFVAKPYDIEELALMLIGA